MSSTLTAAPVRRPSRELAVDRSSRPSFLRLTRIEVRKAVDYRAGRWVLGAILALSVVGLVWRVWHAGDAPISLRYFLESAMLPAVVLLPVLGILAMTSEWSQRTALTTFTLSPRRVPVLLSKLVAALVLGLVVVVSVVALTAAATALAGLVTGDPVSWHSTWQGWAGLLVAHGLNILMGAAFGAIVPITGVALTAFFVAPTLLSIATGTFLKSVGEWFDVFGAFGRLSILDLEGKGWQTVTAVAIWVVVPTVVGLWLSNRREVK